MASPPIVHCRTAAVILGLTMSASPAWPQDAPEPPGPLLGRAHLWLEAGRVDLDGAAAREWGVDREGYLGLEVYRGYPGDFYFGGEIGHAAAGEAVTADGDTIRDFDLLWLELNEKWAFGPGRGFTFDLGLGGAMFYVDGDEVTTTGGPTFSEPLADLGFGAQVFVDFNWRARDLLLGLDVKYQWAFDIIDVDYSNLRVGAHVGLAF